MPNHGDVPSTASTLTSSPCHHYSEPGYRGGVGGKRWSGGKCWQQQQQKQQAARHATGAANFVDKEHAD